ncbi:MAG: sigma-70 family RNA polymerase sigma factor [Phycisphaerales bacterium]|nr:sigma-70 family RNA polymerase sigma factor [Phycisphaerales bacterium]
MKQISDEQLFDFYRRGEDSALRQLIERHQEELLRFLYRLMGDRAGAQDAFQEAFLQVHLSADSFDSSRKFRPWLFTIAANKARDMLRKRGRRPMLDLSAPVASRSGGGSEDGGGTTYIDLLEVDIPAPDAAMDDQERDTQVQRVLAEMPLPLREILLLAYFQRLSYAQIAEDLGIPLGTVKSRLHAAVAAFGKKWMALVADGSGGANGERENREE